MRCSLLNGARRWHSQSESWLGIVVTSPGIFAAARRGRPGRRRTPGTETLVGHVLRQRVARIANGQPRALG